MSPIQHIIHTHAHVHYILYVLRKDIKGIRQCYTSYKKPIRIIFRNESNET